MKKLLLILLLYPFDSNAQDSSKAYQNYDFRAGDKIIFEDDFAADKDGEFPAHWDLGSGQGVVNMEAGIPCFLLIEGNYAKVKPYMKTDKYLTDSFSVEFDTYPTPGAYGIMIYMYGPNHASMNVQLKQESVTWNFSNTKTLSANLPVEISKAKYFNKWHHIAMAYIDDQLKVYVDQYRILAVPHCSLQPQNLEVAGIGSKQNPIIFKDFKIAAGAGMNMLDKLLTDGRFVTHGIRFDVNSAKIKPECMGVINDIAAWLQAHADLKVEIDGHTDSDGADAANLVLSQQRADAVKAVMIKSGINASRLSTKGFGESKPVSDNTTPEGKAYNRRVEFVKK